MTAPAWLVTCSGEHQPWTAYVRGETIGEAYAEAQEYATSCGAQVMRVELDGSADVSGPCVWDAQDDVTPEPLDAYPWRLGPDDRIVAVLPETVPGMVGPARALVWVLVRRGTPGPSWGEIVQRCLQPDELGADLEPRAAQPSRLARDGEETQALLRAAVLMSLGAERGGVSS